MTTARTAPSTHSAHGALLEPLRGYLAPQWWPTWIGFGLIWFVAQLPTAWACAIARTLGHLAWHIARRDRKITLVNLSLAYPQMTASARAALARAHFESLAFSLVEIGRVWFRDQSALYARAHIEGVEHLTAALACNKGVLLLGAHFTTNEIAAAVLPATGHQFEIMYKPSSNSLMNQLALRRRMARGGHMIPSDRFVDLLKTLQRGGIVLYAPDQRFDGQGHITVPLFGVPALSNPGTTFVARATKCAVLPFFPRRLANGKDYVMSIGAPIEGFPCGDASKDVAHYHALIEQAVARAPEQYLWSYKRFRPATGEPDPYRGGAPRGSA